MSENRNNDFEKKVNDMVDDLMKKVNDVAKEVVEKIDSEKEKAHSTCFTSQRRCCFSR